MSFRDTNAVAVMTADNACNYKCCMLPVDTHHPSITPRIHREPQGLVDHFARLMDQLGPKKGPEHGIYKYSPGLPLGSIPLNHPITSSSTLY